MNSHSKSRLPGHPRRTETPQRKTKLRGLFAGRKRRAFGDRELTPRIRSPAPATAGTAVSGWHRRQQTGRFAPRRAPACETHTDRCSIRAQLAEQGTLQRMSGSATLRVSHTSTRISSASCDTIPQGQNEKAAGSMKAPTLLPFSGQWPHSCRCPSQACQCHAVRTRL